MKGLVKVILFFYGVTILSGFYMKRQEMTDWLDSFLFIFRQTFSSDKRIKKEIEIPSRLKIVFGEKHEVIDSWSIHNEDFLHLRKQSLNHIYPSPVDLYIHPKFDGFGYIIPAYGETGPSEGVFIYSDLHKELLVYLNIERHLDVPLYIKDIIILDNDLEPLYRFILSDDQAIVAFTKFQRMSSNYLAELLYRPILEKKLKAKVEFSFLVGLLDEKDTILWQYTDSLLILDSPNAPIWDQPNITYGKEGKTLNPLPEVENALD